MSDPYPRPNQLRSSLSTFGAVTVFFHRDSILASASTAPPPALTNHKQHFNAIKSTRTQGLLTKGLGSKVSTYWTPRVLFNTRSLWQI